MTTCSLPSLPTGPATPQSILLTAVKDIIKAGNLAELLAAFSSQGAEFLICSDWQCASTSQRICTAGCLVRECPHEFSDHVALCSAAFRLSSPVTASAVLSAWNETHLSAISARKIAYKHTFREMGKVLQVDAGRDWGPGQARKPSSGKQTPNWRGFESW